MRQESAAASSPLGGVVVVVHWLVTRASVDWAVHSADWAVDDDDDDDVEIHVLGCRLTY